MSLQSKRLAFGEFLFDVDERVLIYDGKPVALTPKATLLLRFLLENPGRILEKESLMEAVWTDSFVEESNLTFTINAIRKALGDDRKSPTFIETIPKRGYRFIAEVTQASERDIEPREPVKPIEHEPLAVAPPRSTRNGFGAWAMGSIAVLAVIAAGLWFALGGRGSSVAPILSKSYSVEQLSSSGQSFQGVISPDGNFAVYSSESGGRQSLWMRNLESSDSIQIVPPSDDEYLGLTFSNDGKTLFFVRKALGMHSLPSLYRMDLFSSIPNKIVNFVNERVAVSSDDSKIAFVRCRFRPDEFCAAYIADSNGDNEKKLQATENGVYIWEVSFSPDGRSVAIARGRYSNGKRDTGVFSLNIESGEERELFSQRFPRINGLDWLADDSGILFTAPDIRDGKASIWFAARGGSEAVQVTRDAASYGQLSLDKGMEKLIAIQETPNFRLQSVSNERVDTLTAAVAIAQSFGNSKLIYGTFDGEVWSMNADGSEQRQITKSKEAELSLFMSPDGKTIFFSSEEVSGRSIWRMNADGTDRRQLSGSSGGFVVGVSADQAWVFAAMAEDGALFKLPAEGGEPVMLGTETLIRPAVSSNGRYVGHFVLDGLTRKIAITDIETKQVVRTISPEKGSNFARMLSWSADGTRLTFAATNAGRNSLWEAKIDSEPTKIRDIPDGEILSFTALENGTVRFVTGNRNADVMLLRGLK